MDIWTTRTFLVIIMGYLGMAYLMMHLGYRQCKLEQRIKELENKAK